MKKILLLLMLASICLSCLAQKVEQRPLYITTALVDRISGEETTLYTSGGNYYVSSIPGLIEKKRYVFWLDFHDGKPKETRKATIVKFAITTDQAQKDQEKASEELSNRTILKL